MNISKALEDYLKKYPEEASTVSSFLDLVEGPYLRDNNDHRHLTSSVLVMTPDKKEVLLLFHEKLQKWLQPGGHLEEGENPLEGAMRECLEETNIVATITEENLLDVDIHRIPEYKGIREHDHYDLRFLVLTKKEEVPEGLQWIELGDLAHFTKEPSILRMIEKAKVTP